MRHGSGRVQARWPMFPNLNNAGFLEALGREFGVSLVAGGLSQKQTANQGGVCRPPRHFPWPRSHLRQKYLVTSTGRPTIASANEQQTPPDAHSLCSCRIQGPLRFSFWAGCWPSRFQEEKATRQSSGAHRPPDCQKEQEDIRRI